MFADGMCDICMHEKAVCVDLDGFDLCASCLNRRIEKAVRKEREDYERRMREISCLTPERQCLIFGRYKTCKNKLCAMNMKLMANK